MGRLLKRQSVYQHHHAHLWSHYALNLLGDPELNLWLGSPIHVAVEHEFHVLPPNPLEVLVKGPEDAPIERALVCLSGPDDVLLTAYSGPDGRCSFPTRDITPGAVLTLTVTKQQHAPYQATVAMSEPVHNPFVRGDVNDDGWIDIGDAIRILSYLFVEGDATEPGCLKAVDVNDSGMTGIADAIYLLAYLFDETAPPAPPFDACGLDPTGDGLSCVTYDGCR